MLAKFYDMKPCIFLSSTVSQSMKEFPSMMMGDDGIITSSVTKVLCFNHCFKQMGTSVNRFLNIILQTVERKFVGYGLL